MVSLEKLLEESDFISLHTPLTEETRGLIGRSAFELMKPTACLINTSRGPVINQDDLVEALKQKQIAFAGLDVFEQEPIPENHPLWTLDNVTITPHIASSSIETRSKMAEMAATNCVAVLTEKMPPNPVNSDLAKALLQ